MSSDMQNVGTVKDLMEVAGKIILATVALCYGLGLVIVNVHYGSYGVYSAGLFRLNYIVAGLWGLIPILFMVVAVSTLINIVFGLIRVSNWWRKKAQSDVVEKRKKMILLLKSAGVVIALAYLLRRSTKAILGVLGLNLTSDHFDALVHYPFLISVGVVMLFYSYRSKNAHRLYAILIASFFLVSAWMIQTFRFAHDVYSKIPPHLGGGGTKQVQLLVTEDNDNREFLKQHGLEFFDRSNWTKTGNLLLTTDDEVIVIVNRPDLPGVTNTLSIKRDLVKSIHYSGEEGWTDTPTASQSTETPAQTSPSPVGAVSSPSVSP